MIPATKLSTLVISGLLASNVAIAAQWKWTPDPLTPKEDSENRQACVDFSGDWEGTCTAEEEESAKLKLTQYGCAVLANGGNDSLLQTFFSIGGQTGIAQAMDGLSVQITIHPQWSADQDSLFIDTYVVKRVNNQANSNSEHERRVLKIVDGKLNIKDYRDGVLQSHCTLDRQ